MFADVRHRALDFLLKFFVINVSKRECDICVLDCKLHLLGFFMQSLKYYFFSLSILLEELLNSSKNFSEAVMCLCIAIVSNALSCY